MYYGKAYIFQENLDNFLSIAQRLKILGLLQNDNNDPKKDLKVEQQTNDNNDPKKDLNVELRTNAEYEEAVYDSNDYVEINAVSGNNEDLSNIERKVSLINGDQQEINMKVDEHIGTRQDGKLKCLLCGKLGNGNRPAIQKQSMRNHVETHLDGISYQCQFCEKTFRSRDAFRFHKSRNHSRSYQA